MAGAVDSWLITDSNIVNDGDPLWLSFVSGEVFPYGDVATAPDHVAWFVDLAPDGCRDITGYAPYDRGLSIREPIVGVGTHVIGCALRPRFVEWIPAGFEAHLRSMCPDAASKCATASSSASLSARSSRTASSSRQQEAVDGWSPDASSESPAPDVVPLVERRSQFAKTIVAVQPDRDDDRAFQTPLGQRLEIIPVSNPCRWRVGSMAGIRVLLDGHPWPGVRTWAGHEGFDEARYVCEMTTDARGEARVPLTQPGHWFIKAVVFRPATGLGKAQWESFHTSFTFRVRGETDVAGTLRAIRAGTGGLDPWALVGFRVGRRALAELGLEHGDPDLVATATGTGDIGTDSPPPGEPGGPPPSEPGGPPPGLPTGHGIQAEWVERLCDGIWTATGIRTDIEPSEPSRLLLDAARIRFEDRSSGGAVILGLKAYILGVMADADDDDAEALALRIATLSDAELLDVVPASFPVLASP